MSAVPVPSSPDIATSPVPKHGEVLVIEGTDHHLVRIGRGRADNPKVKNAFYSPEEAGQLVVGLLRLVPAARRQELIEMSMQPVRKRPARKDAGQPAA